MTASGSAFIDLYLKQLYEYTSSQSGKRQRTEDLATISLDQPLRQQQQEQLQHEQLQHEQLQQEQLQQEQLQQEQLRQEQLRQEQLRQEQLRQEQLQHEQESKSKRPPKKKSKTVTISSEYNLVSDLLNNKSFELVLPPNHQVSGLLELPANIWLQIILMLPFSHIPELTLVCKHIFIMVRQEAHYGRFMKTRHGIPIKGSYKQIDCQHNIQLEHQSLPRLVPYYGRTCDYCLRYATRTVIKHGPNAVLVVDIRNVRFEKSRLPNNFNLGERRTDNYRLNQIFLCLTCRRDHFEAYPEPIPSTVSRDPIQTSKLKSTMKKFMIPKSGTFENNPSEADLLVAARARFGGDVGIKAERLSREHGSTGSTTLLPIE